MTDRNKRSTRKPMLLWIIGLFALAVCLSACHIHEYAPADWVTIICPQQKIILPIAVTAENL